MKNTAKIYLFDFTTKEYIGSKDAFDDFGRAVEHLNSTQIAPSMQEGFVSVFNITEQAWSNLEDNRGIEGYMNGEHIKIKELGALPADFTLELAEPVKTDDELREEIKAQRDTLLKESDFSQMNDAPLSDEEKEVWKNYRQALRDLPQQELFLTSPKEVQLPAKP